MQENKIIRVKLSATQPISGETDWAHVDAMTDEEVNQAALSDPDAQPTSPEMLKKFRRVTGIEGKQSTQGRQGK